MRITGGVFRSRILRAPRGTRTRPTSDRVREALFGILSAERERGLEGACVLDLYAGTGALAFEALSRGAEHATLVESARPAVDLIRRNAHELGLEERVHIVARPVERAIEVLASRAPYDLVLADPPYALVASGDATRALANLVRAVVVRPDTRIVLEHAAANDAPEIDGLELASTRRYGDTALAFYVPRHA